MYIKNSNDHSIKFCGTVRFFYKQRFFSTQPQYCFTFSWIELQIMLKCCCGVLRDLVPLAKFKTSKTPMEKCYFYSKSNTLP